MLRPKNVSDVEKNLNKHLKTKISLPSFFIAL